MKAVFIFHMSQFKWYGDGITKVKMSFSAEDRFALCPFSFWFVA